MQKPFRRAPIRGGGLATDDAQDAAKRPEEHRDWIAESFPLRNLR